MNLKEKHQNHLNWILTGTLQLYFVPGLMSTVSRLYRSDEKLHYFPLILCFHSHHCTQLPRICQSIEYRMPGSHLTGLGHEKNKILFKEFKFLHWHLGSSVSRPKVNFSITKSISSYPETRLNHTSIISELKLSFQLLRHGVISEEGISGESSELYKMITTNESNRNVLKLQNCVLQSQNLKNHVPPCKGDEQLHPEPPAREMICTVVQHQKTGRDKQQPRRAALRCQLPGTSEEGTSLAKTSGC